MTQSLAEVTQRRERLLENMKIAGVDLAVFTTPASLYYLTGIDTGPYTLQCLIMRLDGECAYIVRRFEENYHSMTDGLTWCSEWSYFEDSQSAIDVVADRAAAMAPPGCVLGVETDRTSISCDDVATIVARVAPTAMVSAAPLVESLRVRKSPFELDLIRTAGRMTAVGLHATAQAFRSGANDAEAAGAAYAAMVSAGSDPVACEPFTAAGPGSALGHAHWLGVRPLEGELIMAAMSASHKRYQCPTERTYFKGEPTARAAEMYEASAAAGQRVLDRLVPGMTSHEADSLARDLITEAGFGDDFRTRLAYGFGIGYQPMWWEHDIMQLRPDDPRLVEEGMVFHLVPAITSPEVGFIQCSRPIVVTESGCEELISFPVEGLRI